MINQTPEQLQEYRARKKFQMDEIARLDYAREEGIQVGRQEGRQEGIQEGIQDGIQKGIQDGIQKGIQDGIQKGIQTGELLGQIGILQSILGISEPTREELLSYDLSQLTALSRQLQQQLNGRVR